MIICESLGTMTLGQIIGDVTNKRLDSIRKKNFGRILTSAAFVGTAGAAVDSGIELSEDLNSIVKMWNPTTDSVINRDIALGLEGYIPSKHTFEIECIDAFSNECKFHASFLEQRPGESLVGKIQGAETTVFESLGTFALNDALINTTKELGYHEVDEMNDRFISWVSLLGSNAVWDCGIEITVDGDFRGSVFNCVSTTEALRHNSWLPANIYVPKGSSLGINGIDAAASEAKLGMKILKLTDSPMAAEVQSAKPEDM